MKHPTAARRGVSEGFVISPALAEQLTRLQQYDSYVCFYAEPKEGSDYVEILGLATDGVVCAMATVFPDGTVG